MVSLLYLCPQSMSYKLVDWTYLVRLKSTWLVVLNDWLPWPLLLFLQNWRLFCRTNQRFLQVPHVYWWLSVLPWVCIRSIEFSKGLEATHVQILEVIPRTSSPGIIQRVDLALIQSMWRLCSNMLSLDPAHPFSRIHLILSLFKGDVYIGTLQMSWFVTFSFSCRKSGNQCFLHV